VLTKDGRARRWRVRSLLVAALALSTTAIGLTAHSAGAVLPDVEGEGRPFPQIGTVAPVRNGTPHLNYYGGPVMPHVKTIAVVYGLAGTFQPEVTSTGAPSISSFLGGVTNSQYFDWLHEYNTPSQAIGRGSFAGLYRIAPGAGRNDADIYDKADIQKALYAAMTTGRLPMPDGNTLYMVFTSKGHLIHMGGMNSRTGFCAYHGGFRRNGITAYYAVMPYEAGNAGCQFSNTAFNSLTYVTSHELIEAVTDPGVALATSYAPPLGWYDPAFGEISDICAPNGGVILGGDGRNYAVTLNWSNIRNGCTLKG
jgi:hypothetical protein